MGLEIPGLGSRLRLDRVSTTNGLKYLEAESGGKYNDERRAI
jgi:hypothetical protein